MTHQALRTLEWFLNTILHKKGSGLTNTEKQKTKKLIPGAWGRKTQGKSGIACCVRKYSSAQKIREDTNMSQEPA